MFSPSKHSWDHPCCIQPSLPRNPLTKNLAPVKYTQPLSDTPRPGLADSDESAPASASLCLSLSVSVCLRNSLGQEADRYFWLVARGCPDDKLARYFWLVFEENEIIRSTLSGRLLALAPPPAVSDSSQAVCDQRNRSLESRSAPLPSRVYSRTVDTNGGPNTNDSE